VQEGVAGRRLDDPRLLYGFPEDPLDSPLVKVVPAVGSASRIGRALRRGKDVLPAHSASAREGPFSRDVAPRARISRTVGSESTNRTLQRLQVRFQPAVHFVPLALIDRICA
jgi:hypothetical protein